jgi:hypothetical protein
MRFNVCVVKPLIDVHSEFFKPFIDVGGEVVKSFVHGFESFVDVGGEVVKSFVHGFKANIHGVLEPVNLRLDMREPSACFGYETSEFGVGNKLMVVVGWRSIHWREDSLDCAT